MESGITDEPDLSLVSAGNNSMMPGAELSRVDDTGNKSLSSDSVGSFEHNEHQCSMGTPKSNPG